MVESFQEFVVTKENVYNELNYFSFKCLIYFLQNKVLSNYNYFMTKLRKKISLSKIYKDHFLICEEMYHDKLGKIKSLLDKVELIGLKSKSMCFINRNIKGYVFRKWEMKIKQIRNLLLNCPKTHTIYNCSRLVI